MCDTDAICAQRGGAFQAQNEKEAEPKNFLDSASFTIYPNMISQPKEP